MGDLLRDIGSNIRKRREEKGLTQQDVATAARVARNTVVRYEAGEVQNLETLGSIAHALETEWVALIPDDVFEALDVSKVEMQAGRLHSKAEPQVATVALGEMGTKNFATDIPIVLETEQLLRETGYADDVVKAATDIELLSHGGRATLIASLLSRLPPDAKATSLALIDGYLGGSRDLRERIRLVEQARRDQATRKAKRELAEKVFATALKVVSEGQPDWEQTAKAILAEAHNILSEYGMPELTAQELEEILALPAKDLELIGSIDFPTFVADWREWKKQNRMTNETGKKPDSDPAT